MFPSFNTLSKTYTFILMPNEAFMGTHFYNSFPEDVKTLKAKLFIKTLCEKHVIIQARAFPDTFSHNSHINN